MASWMEIKSHCTTVCADLILGCINHRFLSVHVCVKLHRTGRSSIKCQANVKRSLEVLCACLCEVYTPFWTPMHYGNDERLNEPLMSQMRGRAREKRKREAKSKQTKNTLAVRIRRQITRLTQIPTAHTVLNNVLDTRELQLS